MDGATLKNALHQRGINLRYLGHVVKVIAQSEHKEHLRHIMVRLTLKTKPNSVIYGDAAFLHAPSCFHQRTAVAEIFIRSTRRVFNSFLQVLFFFLF